MRSPFPGCGPTRGAEAGLRELLRDADDPGALARQALPALARLAVRRRDTDAPALRAAARENAERADSVSVLVLVLVLVPVTEVEQAWLTDRPQAGSTAHRLLLRTAEPAARGTAATHRSSGGDPAAASAAAAAADLVE